MPKWKVFLTMEFTADVEAETEDDARDRLYYFIYNGFNDAYQRDIDNVEVKRWWGGADEVKGER